MKLPKGVVNKMANRNQQKNTEKGDGKFPEDLRLEGVSMRHIFQSQRLLVSMRIIGNGKIEDLETQKKGIDFIRRDNGRCVNVDAKLICGPLETFGMELQASEEKDGTMHQNGWLCNDELKTEEYLFLTHYIKNGTGKYWFDKNRLNNPDDIQGTYALLVEKKTLKKFVEQHLPTGMTLEDARDYVRKCGQAVEQKHKWAQKKTINFIIKDNKIVCLSKTEYAELKKAWRASEVADDWFEQYEDWPDVMLSYNLGCKERSISARVSQKALRSIAKMEFRPEDIEGTIVNSVKVSAETAANISKIIGDNSLIKNGSINITVSE